MKKLLVGLICAIFCLGAITCFAEENKVVTCINGLTVKTEEVYERTFVAKYPNVYIPGNPLAGERINTIITELMKNALQNAESSWQKTAESTYGVDFVITCPNVNNLLSFNFSHYVYDGLEKPHFFFSGMTFDTTTGKMLFWPELVKEEDKIWFNKDTVNGILWEEEKLGNLYLFTGFKGVERMPSNYYVDNYGFIHFQWAPGAIAPYKAGVIDISMERASKYLINKG